MGSGVKDDTGKFKETFVVVQQAGLNPNVCAHAPSVIGAAALGEKLIVVGTPSPFAPVMLNVVAGKIVPVSVV
jgi:hypothetical protein